jgi:hypothetical protein
MHLIETGLEVALAVLLAVLAWAAFVYLSPYRPCRWCRNRKRGRCWRCKGTRLTRRLGARQVHKVKLSLQQAWEER